MTPAVAPTPAAMPSTPVAAAARAAPTAAIMRTEDFIVPAIISALGANQTPTARGALKRLLLGELKTALPDAIVTGVTARVLLEKPTKEECDMLLAAAVNASLLRPGGTADPALQAQLLAAIDQRASSEVRAALADAALHKSHSAEQRAAVIAILMKQEPKNLPAQAKLFNSAKIDEATRMELERRFATFSAAAVDRMLGLTAEGSTGATSGEADEDDGSPEIATLRGVITGVWSDDVVERLAKQAEDAKDLPAFADELQLAVSIPSTAMRTTLGVFNQENWSDGPDAFKLGAQFGDAVHDPGLLMLVKRIPRKEEPPKQKPRTKRGENAAKQKAGGTGKKERWSEKEEKMRYAWMKATEDFVRSLNARFYAAAQAGAGRDHLISRTAAARKAATPGAPISTVSATKAPAGAPAATPSAETAGTNAVASRAGTFPLELHDDAHIVAEYHMCWPDDLPKRLHSTAVTPLAVHYVRMEDTASLHKLNTHYFKQLKGVTSRPRPYGRWMDWMGQGVVHGQDRTVDVIFTRHDAPAEEAVEEDDSEEAKAAARRDLEKVEELTIEILVVEIPEYRNPVTEEEAAEKSKRKWKKGGAEKEY